MDRTQFRNRLLVGGVIKRDTSMFANKLNNTTLEKSHNLNATLNLKAYQGSYTVRIQINYSRQG